MDWFIVLRRATKSRGNTSRIGHTAPIFASVFLCLSGFVNAAQLTRVMVDPAPAPPPDAELIRRSAQTLSLDNYFSQRKRFQIYTVRGRAPDPSQPGNVAQSTVRLSADDLGQVTPRMDELVLMGFDVTGSWVFLDYITDPWLVRAEPWLTHAESDQSLAAESRAPTTTRFYRGDTAIMLKLPVGLDLHAVDILRPNYRGGSLLVTPVMRVMIPDQKVQ